MARDEGIAYWIDDGWRTAVRERLAELKWNLKDLAEKAEIGQGTLSDLMNGVRDTNVHLHRIHRVLGFPPPCPPLLPKPVRRLLTAFQNLGSPEAEEEAIRIVEGAHRLAKAAAKRGTRSP